MSYCVDYCNCRSFTVIPLQYNFIFISIFPCVDLRVPWSFIHLQLSSFLQAILLFWLCSWFWLFCFFLPTQVHRRRSANSSKAHVTRPAKCTLINNFSPRKTSENHIKIIWSSSIFDWLINLIMSFLFLSTILLILWIGIWLYR